MLILPGWQGSGPTHWQTAWERRWGDVRVAQHDWLQPRRGDWCAQLEAAVRDAPVPLALVAHSLGCHLVAAWAAASGQTARVRAALLVAPPELTQEPLRTRLPGWTPLCRQRLPFASTVLASSNDPYAQPQWSAALAADWGSTWMCLGALGHLNADSALGDWPAARQCLAALLDGEQISKESEPYGE